jgi:hypothetical protein
MLRPMSGAAAWRRIDPAPNKTASFGGGLRHPFGLAPVIIRHV